MRIKVLGKLWSLSFTPNLGPGVDGDCSEPDKVGKQIRIRAGLRGQECLETLIHECLHAADWHKDESWIEQVAHDIARAAFRPGVHERIFEQQGTHGRVAGE